MTRARSLSLLANSNIFTVDQSNSRVGIGSTIPDVKLDVDGNMNVSGTLTYEDVTNVETAGITTTGGLVVTGLGATIGGITTFFGDLNFGAAGVGGTITTLGHAEFAGVVTASSYRGDGSQLTGVDSSNLIDSGDTNRVAANTSGVVVTGIATITGSAKISSSEAITLDNNAHTGETLFLRSGGTAGAGNTQALLAFGKADSGSLRTGSALGSIQTDSDTDRIGLAFYTSPSSASSQTLQEQLRITHNGALLVAKTTTSLTTQGSRVDDGLITVSGDSSSTNLATNSGANLSLANIDSTDNNFSNIGGYNSNGLVVNQIDFINKSHSSRTGEIAFLTHNGSAMSERLRITSAGDVGINTVTPRAELSVSSGTSKYNPASGLGAGAIACIESNGNVGLQFLSNSSFNNYIYFGDESSATTGSIQYSHGANALIFRVNGGTERVRIANNGEIGLGGANYGTSGQVLTSNGSGSAPTWQDASGGISTQAGTASGIVTSLFLNDATDHKVTATGICTITTTQSGTEGQSHTIRIVNSGIATVGFSTYFLFPSGAAPVLPIADGAVSIISFTVHDSVGAGCTQLLAGASLNFS